MPPPPLVRRVEILEENVTSFRDEMRAELIGIHGDIAEIRGDIIEIRADIIAIRGDIIGIRGEFALVRDEIRAGDEETRRQMRVLHEEVISRIALLQEGVSNGKARRSRPREKSRPR